MELNLTYPQIALLRELLRKEKHAIWTEKYLPMATRMPDIDDKDDRKIYKKVIGDVRNPWLRQGLCNLILDKIDELENTIQKILC